MNSENIDSENSVEKPGSDFEVFEDENGSEINQQTHDSLSQSTDKITLTSRRIIKRVSVHDDTSNQPKEISSVEDSVNQLESNFKIGIEEIRQLLKSLKSEKKSYELHIRSLEESLRKSIQEKETYRVLVNQMKDEMKLLTAKLEAAKKDNEALHREKSGLQSDHEDHLQSIADQHRRKLLAKKTFRRWKEKLRKGDLPNNRVADLLEENQKLKNELLLYHESAKHAFLRSASALNSEALTLFQDTASRLLNVQQSDIAHQDNFRSSKSDVSDQSSSSSANELDVGRNKENERHIRYPKNSFKSSDRGVRDDMEFYSDDSGTKKKKKVLGVQSRPHSDNELEATFKSGPKAKPRIREFLPDPLRRETRQIMKQLETNRRPNANLRKGEPPKMNRNDLCQSKNHMHICHCTPLPGRPGNCPFCFANQNYNFVNMPTSPKPKPKLGAAFDCNKKSNLFDDVSGQKSRVIYKPSGSTVVIEKHLGN